ncbi:MAG: hypothetical protein ACRC8S_02230 [Fimbriiglobus sp.]
MSRRVRVLLLVGGLVLSGTPVLAQNGDLLERAKALRQVADSKASADVKSQISEAEKLAKASLPTAVRNLRQTIAQLDRSVEISSEKRAELVKLVQDKIAALEGRAPGEPGNLKPKQDPKKLIEAANAETKELKEGLAEIDKLYSQNKFQEAQAKVNELTKKYPDNPVTLILNGQGYVSDRLAEAKELTRQQNERVVLALNDVQRSALPPKGDIEFPKGWREKMEARDKLMYQQLDEDSLAILEALEKPAKNIMKAGPFREVLQSLSDSMQKPIYLREDALREEGTDLNKGVSVPDNVTNRTALRAILQANRLTFIIKEKSIQVVTLDEASKMLVKRAYYIGDVLGSPLGGGATLGPVADFNMAVQNANMIVESIKKTIDPLSWANPSGGGGNSSILFHPQSMSIIVSAPAEVHYSIGRAMKPKR